MKTLISLLFIFSFSILNSQCYLDRHNTSLDGTWVTCNKQESPNELRGNSFWILYDFKSVQKLGRTHFWNINSPDNTDMGIKRAVIDYSDNNSEWFEWTTFEMNEASASGFYEGEEGPDLSGLNARYILITILETHGNICAGFSESRIETFGEVTDVDDLLSLNTSIELSPNPAIDFTRLNIESTISQELNIQIIDMSGKSVSEFKQPVSSGKSTIEIPLQGYAQGQYILNIDNGKGVQSLNLSVINK